MTFFTKKSIQPHFSPLLRPRVYFTAIVTAILIIIPYPSINHYQRILIFQLLVRKSCIKNKFIYTNFIKNYLLATHLPHSLLVFFAFLVPLSYLLTLKYRESKFIGEEIFRTFSRFKGSVFNTKPYYYDCTLHSLRLVCANIYVINNNSIQREIFKEICSM